ncbi:ParB/RepB/Spo0J family partition protein [Pararhizobium gei]|uniref:ParB/RepB/Spo0J family partition protein n=1 Tax=Pararhizobium gei TaxID=1395951 RepID=UPI0023DB1C87|nr:ParB/RepB/Spo0J family partition protein [Rhizobium gei]
MTGTPRSTEFVDINVVEIHDRLRAVNDADVKRVAESMASIGQRTPISVRYYEARPEGFPPSDMSDAMVLWTGATRLAAAKLLDWEKIECFVYDGGEDIDARLWEIAENLHRSELTALERDEHVALWVVLNEERISAQVAPKMDRGRPEGGINAASRELGIERTDAQRAVKVASLSDEAKQAAKEAGLEDNRTALLEAAKHTDAAAQVKALQDRQAKQAEDKAQREINDAHRQTIKDALPQAIKDRADYAKTTAVPTYDGLTADQRIAELEEQVRVLEADYAAAIAEIKTFSEMRAEYELGGFEKVIAGKDETIRGLRTRVSSESEEKARNFRAMEYWKKQAQLLGWRSNRAESETGPSETEQFNQIDGAAEE